MPAFKVQNFSKQDHQAFILFPGTEGCQQAKIHGRMHAVYHHQEKVSWHAHKGVIVLYDNVNPYMVRTVQDTLCSMCWTILHIAQTCLPVTCMCILSPFIKVLKGHRLG
jgi:hypothetical protein